jgi:hypothetical protein
MRHTMNKHLITAAFFLGALIVVWVGAGFLGTSLLALAMTAIIGAVYGFGALELRQFRQASATLANALTKLPDNLTDLGNWLAGVHPSLQNPVRLRIEGERVGLPGPALTPYLVGLLVMLGMLGTFLGMVVTLKGAVFALEKTTDLQEIRNSLAVPIKGLGLAFGTSVAGVAASAMLGLMSALSRRERMQIVQLLDTKIATVLRHFSHTHQRNETYKALQLQSQTLPQVADKLQAMMVQMESMHEKLNQRLITNQESFHTDIKGVYTDLAGAVDKSLRETLSQGAHAASESIKPVVEAAMTGIAREAKQMHEKIADTAQMQLDGLSVRFSATATAQQQQICDTLTKTAQDITDHVQAGANKTLVETTRLLTSAEELMRSRIVAEARWIEQQREGMDQLASLLHKELGALRDEEALRGKAAVERLDQLQNTLQTELTSHLSTLGIALEEPITRLIETASEAPRAAAEVIGKLRQEISNSVARDNELLEERTRILQTLNELLDAINHASTEQRAVIDSLVASSAVALTTAGSAFSETVSTESEKLSEIAANVTSSAVEVSSLSEAFGFAVNSFNEANEKLIANLQRIEGAMDKSMSRSDEQLAYYVAQAREIIDLSMTSQKEIFEELRQLPAKQATFAEGAN